MAEQSVRRNMLDAIIDDPHSMTRPLCAAEISTQRKFNDGDRRVFSTDANNSALISLQNIR